jgi:autotransporter strand-loop-strand O-heptosyltransferase
MKLSIVTSFYNCEKYVDELSESILSQSYQNWEWIVCDDFSTDGTKQKVLGLQAKDPRIRLVEPKRKKEIWWNPQIHATGEIVCPIDGDDKILPNTFEKIVHYFNFFPEAVLMHFNANKYQDVLPGNSSELLTRFVDNVYMSRDNDSFLEGFQRLSPERTGIFGYLRIFRNLPGLDFKVHEDETDCSSNDGQWILSLEEKGRWITIPRTTYIARQHFDSENFRNWNIRGEVKLIEEAVERRKQLELPTPRKLPFFDDIYEAAESTYLSKLNWEDKRCNICFLNFNYNQQQIEKLKVLFFDHNIYTEPDEDMDYVFIRINPYDKTKTFEDIFEKNSFTGSVSLFCDNVHLHHNNRTGINNLELIKQKMMAYGNFYYNYQNNRAYFMMLSPVTKIENNQNQNTKKTTMDASQVSASHFRETLVSGYENTPINIIKERKLPTLIEFNYFGKPRIDVKCEENVKVDVRFIRERDNSVIYQTQLGNNTFAQLNREYHDDFRIEVFDGTEIKIIKPNFKGQRVYIHLDSSSLGDTLAWMPYVDEFRKKHKAQVICSTFHNNLFEGKYPEIEFVKPGSVVHNLYKMFTIGWFYNENEINFEKNPCNFRDQNLQKTASDILGLDFEEIRPKLDFDSGQRPITEKYVCIANHSTAQSKYWNRPEGWQEVVDHLISKGYKVMLLSKEPDGYMGNPNPKGVIKVENNSLKEIMNLLWHSEFFIGLGSGLSWLSWSLGKKTVLISGFSRPICEMKDCIRVFTPEPTITCNGCFNDFKLDAGDWNWCPKHKGTQRQFECTKTISPNCVIDELNKILN